MIFLTAFLTGCSSSDSYIALTEDESNAIAQYCAYLLMKYDQNGTVDEKLLDIQDLEKLQAEAEEASGKVKVTPTPKPEVSPTKAVSRDEGQTSGSDDAGTETAAGSGSQQESRTAETSEYSISEAIGAEGFEFTFKEFEVCEVYKGSSDYYSLSAPKGKQLAIVYLDAVNVSDEQLVLDSLNLNTSYILTGYNDSGSDKYSAQLTLLEDDLMFYSKSFKAGESRTVMLVFYVTQNYNSYSLKIYGDYSTDHERISITNIN